jgi:protocatechuate 3,4-dioxygenase beta subunit
VANIQDPKTIGVVISGQWSKENKNRMKLKNITPLLFLISFATPASSQQINDVIININTKLSKEETTISNVLSDSSLVSLHSLTPFREAIKQNATSEKIKLISDDEPGTRITVKGVVLNKSGNSLANKLVYVYQTSSQGWYSDTAPHILKNEGDRRHARLFGYFKTDLNGKFEFLTIKPKGYPNSTLPAHIHIEISLKDDQSFISELLFDDDPRLVGDIRTRSIKEKFFITKNSGTKNDPVYSYVIRVPD